MLALLLSACLASTFVLADGQLAQNPIIPGWNPDPAPIRVNDTYYLATSSFEFFPGVPLYTSKDLVNWELFTNVLSRPEQLQLYGTPTTGGAWAPSLSYSSGTFYLTSMTRWTYDPVAHVWPRVSWVTSTDLITWSDPIWGEPWGIDPQIFSDPVTGKNYLNLMAPNNNEDRLWGIWQCEVDVASGLCIGEYRSLWNGTLPVTPDARPEGPKMFLKNGTYHLLIAEGGTDLLHRASIARSQSPEGPWESAPNNPILYNGAPDNGNLTIQSTGHGTMIDTPDGDWYIVYLARRNVNGSSPLGRETFISNVEWQDNGWPVINYGRPVLLSEPVEGLPTKIRPSSKTYDFSTTDLAAQGWYTLRTLYTPIYSVARMSDLTAYSPSSSGALLLHPNVFTLSDRDVPAAILRKQTSLNMSFTATTLPIPENLPRGAALGISAYLSELVHHDIGIGYCRNTTTNASSSMCVYTCLARNGTEEYNEHPFEPPATAMRSVDLVIRAEPLQYKLGFRYPDVDGQNSGDIKWLTEFPSSWMAWAPEGWFVFSGAMFALFASSQGRPWGAGSGDVGFSTVEEEFYEERLGDYDEDGR
ncbi:uncharacterized protein LTR77_004634 [Saxophila tyrrhenica]|uniref:Beta-xylosidase C-terminal Concanavalin A-like domain-containing protein n=1 Tax=Saxophila tyrrhenica TaxID=1690608 RepID=A0AAV9PFU5_9PEZI|nr:hypothetical protein LTR77_004634 [Saxophila tyrrhenica]